MEVTELLLLAEEDERVIMDIICDELGVAYTSESTLVLQGCKYELAISIVSQHTKTDPYDFFRRQLGLLYQHYAMTADDSPELQSLVLDQIERSESLVIIQYSYQDDSEIESRVQNLISTLTHR